ncbi:hypothetical protein C8R43DRAFT_961774 [Mycena crocata]|nr:hypothetical protein C8R43DRAFT_961774 [Mycena crocata]
MPLLCSLVCIASKLWSFVLDIHHCQSLPETDASDRTPTLGDFLFAGISGGLRSSQARFSSRLRSEGTAEDRSIVSHECQALQTRPKHMSSPPFQSEYPCPGHDYDAHRLMKHSTGPSSGQITARLAAVSHEGSPHILPALYDTLHLRHNRYTRPGQSYADGGVLFHPGISTTTTARDHWTTPYRMEVMHVCGATCKPPAECMNATNVAGADPNGIPVPRSLSPLRRFMSPNCPWVSTEGLSVGATDRAAVLMNNASTAAVTSQYALARLSGRLFPKRNDSEVIYPPNLWARGLDVSREISDQRLVIYPPAKVWCGSLGASSHV